MAAIAKATKCVGFLPPCASVNASVESRSLDACSDVYETDDRLLRVEKDATIGEACSEAGLEKKAGAAGVDGTLSTAGESDLRLESRAEMAVATGGCSLAGRCIEDAVDDEELELMASDEGTVSKRESRVVGAVETGNELTEVVPTVVDSEASDDVLACEAARSR